MPERKREPKLVIESGESKSRYYIETERNGDSSVRPKILGQGKFAFVYSATQYSEERGSRRVAIKILRPNATISDENLFTVERDIMRYLLENQPSLGLGRDCIAVSEILNIEPLIMCGCGETYVAVCPDCSGPLSAKMPTDGGLYHFLVCGKIECGYKLKAEQAIPGQGGEKLYSSKTKPCCKGSQPNRDIGHIINFKLRPAIVMDVIDYTLQRFTLDRERWLSSLLLPPLHGSPTQGAEIRTPKAEPTATPNSSKQGWVQSFFSRSIDRRVLEDLVEKASIVERLRIMVDLTTAVARLHANKIIHRDLAPDNVMIQVNGHPGFEIQGLETPTALAAGVQPLEMLVGPDAAASHEQGQNTDFGPERIIKLVTDMILHPRLAITIVDFGLAEVGAVPSSTNQRRWYDEERTDNSSIKTPFWSPEAAKYRRLITINGLQRVGPAEGQQMFGYDGYFPASDNFCPLDIVAVKTSGVGHHINDMFIVDVVKDERGKSWARFRGEPPPNAEWVNFEHVQRLGEAHDLFALGVILFNLFVKKDDNYAYRYIENFHKLIGGYQVEDSFQRIGLGHVDRFDPNGTVRNLLGIKFWRNEIATIAIAATIRGRDGSYAKDRAVRGTAPVQMMLRDLKSLYFVAHKNVADELVKIEWKKSAGLLVL